MTNDIYYYERLPEYKVTNYGEMVLFEDLELKNNFSLLEKDTLKMSTPNSQDVADTKKEQGSNFGKTFYSHGIFGVFNRMIILISSVAKIGTIGSYDVFKVTKFDFLQFNENEKMSDAEKLDFAQTEFKCRSKITRD
ncbi:hypothetical protein PCE1_004323 [Barthelona sp. PCE]